MRAFLSLIVLCAIVLQTGCASRRDWVAPKPFSIEVSREEALAGDAFSVDVIGLLGQESYEKLKKAVNDGTYFDGEKSTVREQYFAATSGNRKLGLTFSFEERKGSYGVKNSQWIDIADPIWKTWKDNRVKYIAIVTNLRTGDGRGEAADVNMKRIPHNKLDLPDSLKRSKILTVTFKKSGIVCTPPFE